MDKLYRATADGIDVSWLISFAEEQGTTFQFELIYRFVDKAKVFMLQISKQDQITDCTVLTL